MKVELKERDIYIENIRVVSQMASLKSIEESLIMEGS